MFLAHLLDHLFAHPHLAVAISVWVVLVLHLPYRVEIRLDRHRREHGVWVSALYRYAYGPDYEYLDYDGLRRLQHIILDLLREAWALLRGDVLRRFVDELRRQLGM